MLTYFYYVINDTICSLWKLTLWMLLCGSHFSTMAEALLFLYILETIEQGEDVRRERRFRDRQDPLDLDDRTLIMRYRLTRQAILELCSVLEPALRRVRRTRPIPIHMKVTAALHFYATGSFQNVVSDTVGISQTSCSRIIRDVTDALVASCHRYISYPDTERELTIVKAGFYEIAGFPNVVGAIDCTHIAVKSPSMDEHLFLNRNGWHSVNCQVVCDARLRILDIVARWPGSTHDAFIWRTCGLKASFDGGFVPCGWLLGDSGYPLQPYLLTPLAEPRSPAEVRYNSSHRSTHATIERCFDVLKSRFQCIDHSGGILLYSPDKCSRFVLAVSILHNICITNNIPFDDADIVQNRNDNIDVEPPDDAVHPNAVEIQRQVIARFA